MSSPSLLVENSGRANIAHPLSVPYLVCYKVMLLYYFAAAASVAQPSTNAVTTAAQFSSV
jgi:hypothetical protein